MATKILIFLKWTALVWLNAAMSFYLAMGDFNQPIDILGIICGVFTFVLIYAGIDYYLLKIENTWLKKQLLISILIKALTQCYPAIEIITGILAMEFIRVISLDKISFLSAYLITLTDGLLLSIIVALLILIGKFIVYVKARLKNK